MNGNANENNEITKSKITIENEITLLIKTLSKFNLIRLLY
jgi:hypothetical protein